MSVPQFSSLEKDSEERKLDTDKMKAEQQNTRRSLERRIQTLMKKVPEAVETFYHKVHVKFQNSL